MNRDTTYWKSENKDVAKLVAENFMHVPTFSDSSKKLNMPILVYSGTPPGFGTSNRRLWTANMADYIDRLNGLELLGVQKKTGTPGLPQSDLLQEALRD